MMNIVQWNARSAIVNKTNLEYMLKTKDIDVAIISETWFKPNSYVNFSGYNVIREDRDDGKAGVAILVKNSIPYTEVSNYYKINNVMSVCISVRDANNNRDITIISIYSVPLNNISSQQWDRFISSFRAPIILAGDFNCHHFAWGCDYCDAKGNNLLNSIDSNNLIILNDGSPTLVNNIRQSANSAVDLTICSPEVADKFQWSVEFDPMGSNHFPIFISSYELMISSVRKFIHNWDINKADWDSYKSYLENADPIASSESNAYNKFVSKLYNACECSIPKRKIGKKVSLGARWWDVECEQSLKNRKSMFLRYKSQPNLTNWVNYKKVDAEFKKLTKEKKRCCWKAFCSGLTRDTPIKQIWQIIGRLKNRKTFNKPPLSEGEWNIEFLNKLAPPYVQNEIKIEPDGCNNFLTDKINISELRMAMKSNRNTSPGMDEVHYIMLSNMPTNCQLELLNIFNNIWLYNDIPDAWKKYVIIPLLKPGKASNEADSYRPISLSSCILKTFERIIKGRIEWWIESNERLPNFQFGFRKGKSTYENLTSLITDVQLGFSHNKSTLSLFLDISGAYDSVQLPILVQKMLLVGLPAKIVEFISKLISNRHLFLRINDRYVSSAVTQVGLPQGGILSPILFNIYSSDMKVSLPPSVSIVQYADDICIYYTHKSLEVGVNVMGEAADAICAWCNSNGLTVSGNKSVVCPFTKCRRLPLGDEIVLGNTTFPCVEKVKFLGLHLERKLNWNGHIKETIKKVEKLVNVLRMVSHLKWGADPSISLLFYRSSIRAVMDYGSIFYGEANKTSLKKLDILQNRCMRLCLGYLKSTPVDVMLCEAGEMPLNIRRKLLADRYIVKLISSESPISIKISGLVERVLTSTYWRKKRYYPLICDSFSSLSSFFPQLHKASKPLSFCTDYKVSHNAIVTTSLSDIIDPPFEVSHHEWQAILAERWAGYEYVYTDGSKINEQVGCAFLHINTNYSRFFKLNPHLTVYSAELVAISEALGYIMTLENNNILIITDSMSAIQHFKQYPKLQIKNPNILNISIKLSDLRQMGKTIQFLWVKSHAGIYGNDRVDYLAKVGAERGQHLEVKLNPSDLKEIIKSSGLEKWQVGYIESRKGLFYKNIRVSVNKKPWFYGRAVEKDACRIICRLRSNHGLCQSYLSRINMANTATCDNCGDQESLEHIVMRCPKYDEERKVLLDNLGKLISYSLDYVHILKAVNNQQVVAEIMAFFKNIKRRV